MIIIIIIIFFFWKRVIFLQKLSKYRNLKGNKYITSYSCSTNVNINIIYYSSSLASRKRGNGKQCRPRSDAASDQVYTELSTEISVRYGTCNISKQTRHILNWKLTCCKRSRGDLEDIRHKWVHFMAHSLFCFVCLFFFLPILANSCTDKYIYIYGPWKLVRDMSSSGHWGLIMTPGQEANDDNLGIFFAHLDNNSRLSVLIRIRSMGRF